MISANQHIRNELQTLTHQHMYRSLLHWHHFQDSCNSLLTVLLPADKKDDKVEPDDLAITMDGTQDASKLGRQVAPGESSSSSSSSSSDGQAEPFYSGVHTNYSPHRLCGCVSQSISCMKLCFCCMLVLCRCAGCTAQFRSQCI